MEKNGNWSVITRNCPELVRKFYLFNKIFKKMKNRESGKFPGNGREMPGNFLDFGTTEKLQKIPKNLESWVYYFPVSRFPGFSVLISQMKFPGFPVSRCFCSNFPDEISRFPGFGQTFLDFPVSRFPGSEISQTFPENFPGS